ILAPPAAVAPAVPDWPEVASDMPVAPEPVLPLMPAPLWPWPVWPAIAEPVLEPVAEPAVLAPTWLLRPSMPWLLVLLTVPSCAVLPVMFGWPCALWVVADCACTPKLANMAAAAETASSPFKALFFCIMLSWGLDKGAHVSHAPRLFKWFRSSCAPAAPRCT